MKVPPASPGPHVLTVNQALFDRGVRHAVTLERLRVGEARRITRFLDAEVFPELEARVLARLSRVTARGATTGLHTTARLRSLGTAIEGIIQGARTALGADVSPRLEALAIAEAQFQAARMREAVPSVLDLDFITPPTPILRAVVATTIAPATGRLFVEELDTWANALERGTKAAVNRGLAIGDTNAEIARRLSASSGVSRRQAATVVRTYTTAVTTQARELTYQDNAALVRAVKYVSTLDAKTTYICISLDGQLFPVGQGERPPMHHQCRSTTVPVLRSWRELGITGLDPATRASMNGQVPEDVTYFSWLRGQTTSIQNEALGVRRAQLFRAGKITDPRVLVDQTGRSLTIEQLEATLG